MDGHTDVLREGGRGGGLTCHARALKFSRKLWRYKKFIEKCCLLNVNFDQFMTILVLEKKLYKKQCWSTEI